MKNLFFVFMISILIPQVINAQNKELKSNYRNGVLLEYYEHNGVSVVLSLSVSNSYGKYYSAHIMINNSTGKSFNFNPDDIRVIFNPSGKRKSGEVVSCNEYLRKVNLRQKIQAYATAYNQMNAANSAGYTTSKTRSESTTLSNSYGSAYGNVGDTYVSATGTGQSIGTTSTNRTTTTYNEAAGYAAKQNAQYNINNLLEMQDNVRGNFADNYLRINTLDNGCNMNGYVNIKYEKAEEIFISIPVNGEKYDFWFKYSK